MYDFNVFKALLWIKIANISIEAFAIMQNICNGKLFAYGCYKLETYLCIWIIIKLALIVAVEYLHKYNTIFGILYPSTSHHLTICDLFIIQTCIFYTHFIQNNVFCLFCINSINLKLLNYTNSTAHSWIVHTKNF